MICILFDWLSRGGAVVVPTLSLLLPLGAYGALTAAGVDSNKAGEQSEEVQYTFCGRGGVCFCVLFSYAAIFSAKCVRGRC